MKPKPLNAFTWRGKPSIQIKPTRVSKAAATRVNREQHICGSTSTNSEREPA